jgi:hypothetical protein
MNKLMITVNVLAGIGLVFVLSCNRQSISIKPKGDTGEVPMRRVTRTEKEIAKEIVSIYRAAGEALLRVDNTDEAKFAAEFDLLSSRLENISKELDALGPFSLGLREVTRKEIDSTEKLLRQLDKGVVSRPMQTQTLGITEKTTDRYFQAWGSVNVKAGLDEVGH